MQKPFPLKLKAFGHVEMLYTKGLETLEMNNLSMYLWAIAMCLSSLLVNLYFSSVLILFPLFFYYFDFNASSQVFV
jgi:hypothetical protein